MGDLRLPWSLAIVLGACVGACGGEAPGPPEAMVRDSAGVRVVENPAVEDLGAVGWVLSEEPLIDIGALDGPLETQLFRVRDALRLEDGRLLVLNSGSGEVRVFDDAGGYLESWGGEGDGPGEFASARLLLRWSVDSIAVWDDRHRRLTRFGLDGGLGASTVLPLEDTGRPNVTAMTDAGDLLMSTALFSEGLEDGYTRIPTRVSVARRSGEEVGDLGVHPGAEVVLRLGEGTISVLGIPITRTLALTPVGDEIMVAGTERLSFNYFDLTGAPTAVVRFPNGPRLLTEADRDAALEEYVSRMPEPTRAGIRQRADEFFPNDTLPAYSRLVVDATGHQWVQLYRPSWTPGPNRWMIMDAEGTAMGHIEMPSGLTIHEIGVDYVLGRMTDELEIEYVQLWGLERQ